MFGFRRKQRLRDGATEPASIEDAVVVVERTLHPYLVSIHDPDGPRAEQLRGLRNKLLVMNPDGAARTLVITSAVDGEGKTVTTINLGATFAELEETRVLLVDADLRRPSLERFLGLTPGRGLTDLLQTRLGLEQAIRPSGIDRLDILGAGRRPANPSELLASRRMDDLFAQLKEEYQYVLVDTPPVTPITDASVLAAKADGCLLVVRLEHGPRQQVLQAARTIQELGGNLLGTFITDVRGGDPDAEPRYATDGDAARPVV